MSAFYNEIDPFAAQWLRNLIAAGHIADGVVDTRSISDITPEDLHGFTQCHFFAGIGVWSHALRLAQWPDTKPVWTGSCPCQPFSVAGGSAGVLDERHLWPHWYWLIEQCRPAVIFGEQVDAAAGHGWLDLVQSDLEGIDYAVGHASISAAGVGAPHIRQRLWFVAEGLGHHHHQGLEGLGGGHQAASGWEGSIRSVTETGELGGLADAQQHHCETQAESTDHGQPQADRSADWAGGCSGASGGLANPIMQQRPDRQPGISDVDDTGRRVESATAPAGLCSDSRPGPTNGFWRDADWLGCRDGKWRPVEPGTFPLVNGASSRVGRLRAYGNAIVPQVAKEVIAAYMACRP